MTPEPPFPDLLPEDLEAFLDEQRELTSITVDDESVDGPQRRYAIPDAAHADWALGKVSAARARVAAREEFARERIAEIEAWLDQANRSDVQRAEWFESLVREWAAAEVLGELARVRDWSKVTKRISLPNGVVRASRSNLGRLVAPANAVRNAAQVLSEIDRDTIVDYDPKLTAARLEQAVADGIARVGDDGTYEVKVTDIADDDTWVRLDGVRREGRGEISFSVETSS